ncbi:MAG: RNA methyltransferase [Firmicutes bacterium]|nr:RNA methyltransferase [Bacillota bacterium]
MKTIRSKDNPSYKEAVKLLRRKYRDQTGMFLIEGPRPVMDAIRSGESLQTVFLSEEALEKKPSAASAAEELEDLCMKNGCRCAVLAEELFSRVSDTEHSQGVLAVACKPGHRKIEDGTGVIILDRLQDPGNIGTIIRTAEAAGFGTLIAIKGTGDIYAPKTVRAAAGSLLRVNVFEGLETGEAVRLCREQGIRIIASDLEGSVEYTTADLTGDIALVIGNEGSGVSNEIRQAADSKVRIPMEGTIESLNAAVAAGLLMYESVRQRRAAGKVK